MPVAALVVDLQIPQSATLKDKRMVVRHLLDAARHRYGVACAEHDHHDLVQRAELVFAAAGRDVTQVEAVLDTVERYVWSHPEVLVLETSRHWLELDLH
jgi:hypothetical protein